MATKRSEAPVTLSRQRLHRRAFGGLALLHLAIAAIVFVPAGTLDFWQAWLFLALYAASSTALTLHLMLHDPALLQRRMRGGAGAEQEPAQKTIMRLMSVGFAALFIVPGLDHRFGWSDAPWPVAMVGEALVMAGWAVIFVVFRQNTFAAATIGLAPDQRVITTGLYARIRHPMYAGGLAMLAGIPLALGSWWGLLPLLATAPVLAWRLLDEEAFLRRNLAGYSQYCSSVRSRLIPCVW